GIVGGIEGVADPAVEQVAGLPMLTVMPKRTALSRYGLNVGDVQDLVATAIGGESAGLIFDGDRRFDLAVRLPEEMRIDPQRLARLPLPTADGTHGPGYVPLAEVASLEYVLAPNQISREDGKRRVVVTANVRGRDLGSFVAEAQERIAAELVLPPGY